MPSKRRSSLRRKRPCRICRKWFFPDPRVKDRQKTCGDPACQREWHRKQCARWNRANRHLQGEKQLAARLEAGPDDSPRLQPRLPVACIQEVFNRQQTVIIEFVAQLLFRCIQEEFRVQHDEINKISRQLLAMGSQDELAIPPGNALAWQGNRSP